MKLTKGVWEHLKVEGHDDSELWQKFYDSDGKHWQAYNQHHVGEVVTIQDGKAVNLVACPVCGGSARIKCSGCDGTGQVICPSCRGTKVVAENWTPPVPAKPKTPAKLFRLKDGRSVSGRIEMQFGSKVYIRMEDGKSIEVDVKEIVPEMPKQ